MRNTRHLQARLGLHKSKVEKTDYLVTTLVEDVIEDLPTKLDITDEMSPVKNQGAEGACAGFAGVAVKEWMEIKDYGLTDGKYIDLSERQLYEKAKKISGHSEGTTLKAISKVLLDDGVCEDVYWPYKAKEVGQSLPGAEHNALKYKILSYVRVGNLEELKASLFKFGPVLIGVTVSKNWYRQKNGHIPNANFCERIQAPLGGHAITVVGYNDETQEIKFKNSWGTSWGKEGFGWMSYKELKRTLMDAVEMIDIDDPEEYRELVIKRVCNLTLRERRNTWI